MIRRINAAAILTLIFVFASSVLAQSAPVTGRVLLKKSDGTTVPVVGAIVEAFQTDIKAKAPPDKTDKKGQFSFAGLKLGATYVLSVSGPGASPTYVPNIKAGNENLTITLDEGDGRKFTEAEVRAAIAQGATAATAAPKGELTAEQKKALAEHEAKINEVKGKNEKALKANEVVNKALQDGNAAYTAKNYDAAVASYDTGIAADPDFVGSAPVLLNNKAAALTARAVALYNQNAKATDATAKLEAFKKVRKDFADAVVSYDRSLKILKAATPADGADPKTLETNKINALRGAKDTFRYMAMTEQVDMATDQVASPVKVTVSNPSGTTTSTVPVSETMPRTLKIAGVLISEYNAIETDTAKKLEAQLILADVYRVAGDSENAILAYRQVLEGSPNNMDAMAGLGFSLVNIGYVNNDKTKLQEGANYLQKFATAAPDTNKFKGDALGLIETLKKEQNVTPVKAAGGGRKKS